MHHRNGRAFIDGCRFVAAPHRRNSVHSSSTKCGTRGTNLGSASGFGPRYAAFSLLISQRTTNQCPSRVELQSSTITPCQNRFCRLAFPTRYPAWRSTVVAMVWRRAWPLQLIEFAQGIALWTRRWSVSKRRPVTRVSLLDDLNQRSVSLIQFGDGISVEYPQHRALCDYFGRPVEAVILHFDDSLQ